MTGLAFWRIRLSEEAPPVLLLFVYEDDSPAIWDPESPDVFPRGAPFKLPAPAPDQEVISIVSDADTVGYAFFVGVPWIPPQPGSVHLVLWSPEHATWTSNTRESMTLLIATKTVLSSRMSSKRPFLVFVSDNTCAVAMATHLYSSSTAIETVAITGQKGFIRHPGRICRRNTNP